jgi:hypothetical protein
MRRIIALADDTRIGAILQQRGAWNSDDTPIPVGAGLLANAAFQSATDLLTHRVRQQAGSHSSMPGGGGFN